LNLEEMLGIRTGRAGFLAEKTLNTEGTPARPGRAPNVEFTE
jgi:hypothetical protein